MNEAAGETSSPPRGVASRARSFVRAAVPSRADAAQLALLALALAVHRFVPAVGWGIPVLLCATVFVRGIAGLPRGDRRWAGACALVAAVLFCGVLAVFGYHQPLVSDPRDFMEQSSALAEAWRGGWYPAISLKGSPPYMGTLHTGYQRVLALLFLVAGPGAGMAVALNGLCVVLLPAGVMLLARELWHGAAEAEGPRWPGGAHRMAALLAAAYPGFLFWGTWVLKDLLLAALFVFAAWMLLRALRRRTALDWALFALSAAFCATVRAYAGLSLLLGLAAYGVALLPRRRVFMVLLYALLLALLASYGVRFGVVWRQLWFSVLNLVPDGATSSWTSLAAFAAGVPRLLLGPYAWVRAHAAPGFDTYYGLYPGMWVLYLLVYPLATAGLWFAARRNHLPVVIPVVCVGAAWILFLATYGGLASRQRLYLEPLLMCLAGAGWMRCRRGRWIAAWAAGVILFAGGQLLSLSWGR